jgi:phosphoglycerate-specific signal transduction histidine kinase
MARLGKKKFQQNVLSVLSVTTIETHFRKIIRKCVSKSVKKTADIKLSWAHKATFLLTKKLADHVKQKVFYRNHNFS